MIRVDVREQGRRNIVAAVRRVADDRPLADARNAASGAVARRAGFTPVATGEAPEWIWRLPRAEWEDGAQRRTSNVTG